MNCLLIIVLLILMVASCLIASLLTHVLLNACLPKRCGQCQRFCPGVISAKIKFKFKKYYVIKHLRKMDPELRSMILKNYIQMYDAKYDFQGSNNSYLIEIIYKKLRKYK